MEPKAGGSGSLGSGVCFQKEAGEVLEEGGNWWGDVEFGTIAAVELLDRI